MKQTEITSAYYASAEQYVTNCYNELDEKPLDRLLLNQFAASVGNGGKVCDVGCGPGQTTRHLLEQGCDVLGMDLSAGMIAEAKKLNPQIPFQVGDMFKMPFEINALSGICSFYAVVNFRYPELEQIFNEYNRVLKANGFLLLAFHTEEKEIHVEDFFGGGYPLDFYYFDENRIIELLEKSGFAIKQALVRFPYASEYPSKRAYVLAEAVPAADKD